MCLMVHFSLFALRPFHHHHPKLSGVVPVYGGGRIHLISLYCQTLSWHFLRPGSSSLKLISLIRVLTCFFQIAFGLPFVVNYFTVALLNFCLSCIKAQNCFDLVATVFNSQDLSKL